MKSLVWHPVTRLTLDFSQVDFGGPEQEEVISDWLARREANLRPLTRKGDFVCVQHRDHENPWLELRQLPGQIIAAHWKGRRARRQPRDRPRRQPRAPAAG